MLPTGNADLEIYGTMEHEGVTSPCSFFFPPLSGCDQPRPKGQPIPPAGYLVSDIKQKGEPLSYVSCRGTPFTLRCSRVSQSKPTCGADNDIPLQCVDACVPTLVLVLAGTYAAARCSPLIRAGRSHLPCGTIGRARLAEKMGGTGEGNANKDKASSYWRSI